LNGWTLLRDLSVGDFVAAPRVLAVTTEETWPEHELIALAGLLSEGNLCHPTSLYFYANDERQAQDFARAAGQFPATVSRITTRPNRRCLEVCVNMGRGARGNRGQRGEGGLAVAAPVKRSGAYRWAERLGILGHRATEKFVPAEVFRLRTTDVALFLGRLWAGDGFIASETLFVPYYATSSERLARDVQTLLLRLGIISGIHAKSFKYRGGTRPGFTVHLLGHGSIRRFLELIAPHALGREKDVQRLRDYTDATDPDVVFKDTIPAGVRAWVDEERQRLGLTWDELESASGLSMRAFCSCDPRKRGFRRSTIARLAQFFASKRLRQVADSDVFWDCIVAIQPCGEAETYDLTVDGDHNFVANGLIVHNSHTAAYAQLGYQTAYLKAHVTAEFMAALLTSEIEDSNKRDIMVDHIADARKLGVTVLPPDVNLSESDFTVSNGQIVFGLAAIKGCGRQATDAIVAACQAGGKFRDLFDFCERVDLKLVTRAAIERLIKAGAFDGFRGHRAQLMNVLGRALQSASERQNDLRVGQRGLFDGGGSMGTAPVVVDDSLPDVEPWPNAEKLKYEKEVLDFYFSSHPLAEREKEVARYVSHTVAGLKGVPGDTEVTLGGMLSQVRIMTYKKPQRNGNTRYGRCKIEDLTGMLEAVMWGDEFIKYKDVFVENQEPVLVRGKLERKTDEPVLQITRVLTLDQAKQELARELHLLFRLGRHSPVDVDVLAGILRRTPGNCPVVLTVKDQANRVCVLRLGREFNINPALYLKDELEGLLGEGAVQLR
jgi:DNA polymerase-3 subunit alpha